MKLQVPHCVCSKISKEGIYRRKMYRGMGAIEVNMSVEGGRNHRRRSMPGSYTYADKHPAPNERFGVHGLFERSALMIFQKWGNMKFAYRNRELGRKGDCVDTVGKNTK